MFYKDKVSIYVKTTTKNSYGQNITTIDYNKTIRCITLASKSKMDFNSSQEFLKFITNIKVDKGVVIESRGVLYVIDKIRQYKSNYVYLCKETNNV